MPIEADAGDRDVEIDALWDYGDPAASESRFRAKLKAARERGDDAFSIELIGQLARSLLCQERYDEARATLDEAARLLDSKNARRTSRERARFLLELGRYEWRMRNHDRAKTLFLESLEMAQSAGADFHAVDAAHMLALNEQGEQRREWEQRALALVLHSTAPDARKWLGTLHQNMGATDCGQGRLDSALDRFREAVSHYEAMNDEESARISTFCVGLTLRRLHRPDEALAVLLAACREPIEGTAGEVFLRLEAGLSLAALGRHAEADSCFRECHTMIQRDPSIVRDQPQLMPWLEGRLEKA